MRWINCSKGREESKRRLKGISAATEARSLRDLRGGRRTEQSLGKIEQGLIRYIRRQIMTRYQIRATENQGPRPEISLGGSLIQYQILKVSPSPLTTPEDSMTLEGSLSPIYQDLGDRSSTTSITAQRGVRPPSPLTTATVRGTPFRPPGRRRVHLGRHLDFQTVQIILLRHKPLWRLRSSLRPPPLPNS